MKFRVQLVVCTEEGQAVPLGVGHFVRCRRSTRRRSSGNSSNVQSLREGHALRLLGSLQRAQSHQTARPPRRGLRLYFAPPLLYRRLFSAPSGQGVGPRGPDRAHGERLVPPRCPGGSV